MITVRDNTNIVGSLTISSSKVTKCGTDWSSGTDLYIDGRRIEDMISWTGYFPTTDGGSPVSNAITESYMNILCPYRIDRVIFHDPATVVYWKDGTKTVVKCHNEPFDREKGLAMCIAKKVLGEKFHQVFREWCCEDGDV